MTRLTILFTTLALGACASTPTAPPREFAEAIAADLAAGRTEQASERYEDVADDEDYREQLYPVLFDAARVRYEGGDGSGAAAQLRFLADVYPDSRSVHEALVYALFLQRSSNSESDPALVAELTDTLGRLATFDGAGTSFVDLVAAQAAVDRGDSDAARTALDRFLQTWDGLPVELMPYIEDLSRAIAANHGGSR